MGATKEYFLKLSEEKYSGLGDDEKMYLNYLGLQVKQLPSDEDLNDENYKKIRSNRIKAWNNEQEYLFNRRNN